MRSLELPESIITKLLTLAAMMGLLGEAETGVGAYYTEPGLMHEVCEHRARNGWMPAGIELYCDWPCLISAIHPKDMGRWALVAIPGSGLHF